MSFPDILEKVGSVGRFQIIHILLLALPVLFMASHNLLQNFVAVVPDHHCRVRLEVNVSSPANTTTKLQAEELLRAFIPLDRNQQLEQCRMYSSPQWHLLDPNATWRNTTEYDTQICTDGWTYNLSQFKATVVTEWDLVCSSKALREVAQSVYMGGVLSGSIILGRLSDRYGRRILLLWSHFLVAIAGTCGAFASSYSLFCFWRFLSGLALSGVILNSFCLSLEWIPTKVRTGVSTYFNYSYTFGQLLLVGVAYGIRDWRWLQFAVAFPFYVFFLYSWWFPESARWLILNDKADVALKHLKRVAKLNGKEEEGEKLTTAILKSNMEKELSNIKETYSVLDLFKTPVMCKTACCTMLIWFSTSFAYYGLAIDLQGFGVDIYLIQIIFGAVDIPAKLVGVITLSYIGRRFTQGTSLILAGSIVISNIFIPKDFGILKTSLAAIGKGCLATAFSCCYLHAGELYPTVVRQTGIGLVTTMARVGSMVSPVVKLTGETVAYLPMLIYGGMAIVSGISAFLLPETLNKPLPDTIEEVEGSAKKDVEKADEPKKDEIPLQGTQTSLMQRSFEPDAPHC
ncbi:solute carrier family 22 member 6-A-like [Carcharodon carcharias]|uniref:solute carrier family 22 member 6-A-like n=1 Tax=Carcharodon carcharias TaxID=13397 RepID=UPI001B7E5212|nr:solute carrier family 22 member 6-A-like [Carcharodon carcharias]